MSPIETPYLSSMVGIYTITNPKNKLYVGQSIDLERRKKDYSSNTKSRRQQRKIDLSIKKYGWENHTFKIIKECKEEDLNELEIYYIKKYNSIKEGLNISEGGYYFHKVNIGRKHTKKTIKKMKDWWSKNKTKRSKETIEKISKTKRENPRVLTPQMIENHRKSSPNKKPILQYDMDGNFIKEYESINSAARDLGGRVDNISAMLRGKQKSSYGFIWEYKNK